MITDLKNLTISIEIIHYVQFIEYLKAHKVIKDTGVDIYMYSKRTQKDPLIRVEKNGLGKILIMFCEKKIQSKYGKTLRIFYFGYGYKEIYNV